MSKKTRIVQALYGSIPVDTLTQAEIDFATSNLPNEDKTGTHNAEEVDFTGFKFTHNTDSSNEAVGLTKRDIILLDRKIQDAEMENRDEESPVSGRRSRTIEILLPRLCKKEIVWLIDSGVLFINERKKTEALKSILGLGDLGRSGGDPDIEREED